MQAEQLATMGKIRFVVIGDAFVDIMASVDRLPRCGKPKASRVRPDGIVAPWRARSAQLGLFECNPLIFGIFVSAGFSSIFTFSLWFLTHDARL